ncbi:MAG TPA: sigma 54-interacting transcriptional regulator [Kofleriaceae bacterium]|nr:sigma 54-interacting transcriptional regulator [Kofleriaceae bacterium]
MTKTVTGASVPESDPDAPRELPRLIVVLHTRKPFAPAVRLCMGAVDEVVIGRGAGRSWRRIGRRLELSLDDHEISRQHACLRRLVDGWELVDLDSKNGTKLNGVRARRANLVDSDVIEVGAVMLMFRDESTTTADCGDLDMSASARLPPALRTASVDVEAAFAQLIKIAPSLVPVLIRGETGTGKELTARAIHDLSGRRGMFVPVNCGAIPRTLVESELFGSKRGAFSGARDDREGLVRRADGGTLFLDEIAELPEESQVALLRVLQEGEVRPVGATECIRIDVRIVAATHQDLETRIAAGTFRQDLYARLIGFVTKLAPLRARREDLGTLVSVLLARIVDDPQRITIQQPAARALMSYAYPLNIRELEQALRAAVALSGGGEIGLEHLPEAIRNHRVSPAELRPEDQALRDRVVELLRDHRGNVTAVARTLGKAPIQIRRWCRRLSIEIAAFRA